jgi:hypothetical protein
MAAPKKPNTEAARAASLASRAARAEREKIEDAVALLTSAGWLLLDPSERVDLAEKSDAFLAGYIRQAIEHR